MKSTAPKLEAGPVQDPAGLDQLLMAAAKGGSRYFERLVSQQLGRKVNLWDGPDGLGAVLEEHMKAAGVPNKRLPDLLTPRLVVSNIVGKPRRPRRRVR